MIKDDRWTRFYESKMPISNSLTYNHPFTHVYESDPPHKFNKEDIDIAERDKQQQHK